MQADSLFCPHFDIEAQDAKYRQQALPRRQCGTLHRAKQAPYHIAASNEFWVLKTTAT
jgi:hypothetical protein